MGRLTFEEYQNKANKKNVEIQNGNHLQRGASHFTVKVPTRETEGEINFIDIIEASYIANDDYKDMNENELIPTNLMGIKENAKIAPKILSTLINEMVKANPQKKSFIYTAINASFMDRGIDVQLDINAKNGDIMKEFIQNEEITRKMAHTLASTFDQTSFAFEYETATNKMKEQGLLDLGNIKTPEKYAEVTDIREHMSNIANRKLDGNVALEFASKKNDIQQSERALSNVRLDGYSLMQINGNGNNVPYNVSDVLERASTGFRACMGEMSTKDGRALVSATGFEEGYKVLKALENAHNARPWYKKLAGFFGGEAGKETKLLEQMKKEFSEKTGVGRKDIDNMLHSVSHEYYDNAEAYIKDNLKNTKCISDEDFSKIIGKERAELAIESALNLANEDLFKESAPKKIGLENIAKDTGAIDNGEISKGKELNDNALQIDIQIDKN